MEAVQEFGQKEKAVQDVFIVRFPARPFDPEELTPG